MQDIQNQLDERGITIQQTGVNNVCLPFLILMDGKTQPIQAAVKFTVSLSQRFRGTHMSRLMEILTDWTSKPVSISDFQNILVEATDKLSTNAAAIRIAFKYFVEREAPVSGKASLLDVDCVFDAELVDGRFDSTLSVKVPLTTLCPCSREISDFGAHNQRSVCTLTVKFASLNDTISINGLVKLVEAQASSPLYSILKREDEKHVTEAAYQNPKFVEDILRDVVIAARQINGVKWFRVECENFESIHNHNAYACHEEIFNEHTGQELY